MRLLKKLKGFDWRVETAKALVSGAYDNPLEFPNDTIVLQAADDDKQAWLAEINIRYMNRVGANYNILVDLLKEIEAGFKVKDETKKLVIDTILRYGDFITRQLSDHGVKSPISNEHFSYSVADIILRSKFGKYLKKPKKKRRLEV